MFAEKGESIPKVGLTIKDILKRSQIYSEDLVKYFPEYAKYPANVIKEIEIELKYEGYLAKQNIQIEQSRKQENTTLSVELDYSKIKGLRMEARQKLNAVKPLSLGQASRISGVSPADIAVLTVYLKTLNKNN